MTWNIRQFPQHSSTKDYVKNLMQKWNADIYFFQEMRSESELISMVDTMPNYSYVFDEESGNLGFATVSATLNHGDISDNSTTVSSSATTQIDSFSSATYRSAKYFISITDATNGRYEIVEANVIHGPSADSTIEAYLTVFGSTTSYSAPLCTFTADIDDGNVRLLATNISSDSCVFKFQRIAIDL